MKRTAIILCALTFAYTAYSQNRTVTVDDSMKFEIDTTTNNYINTAELLSDISLKEYEKLILDKTKDLSDYISLLTDHNTTSSEAREIKNLALDLFSSDTCIVEVTFMKNGEIERTIKHTIADYLKKLVALRTIYDNVKITWSDISYVSRLRPAPDNKYYGVVTIQQRFEGFKDGLLVYGDVTEKHIEVVLQALKVDLDGNPITKWEIMLSDIGVEQTSSI